VRVGEGAVNFPFLAHRLRELGYKGEFIIEREITGDEQKKDIAHAVEYLRALFKEIE
jgi:sugar phosphate isomerase/epimerase